MKIFQKVEISNSSSSNLGNVSFRTDQYGDVQSNRMINYSSTTPQNKGTTDKFSQKGIKRKASFDSVDDES